MSGIADDERVDWCLSEARSVSVRTRVRLRAKYLGVSHVLLIIEIRVLSRVLAGNADLHVFVYKSHPFLSFLSFLHTCNASGSIMTKSEVPMYEKDEERYKTISGNASAEVKQSLADGLSLFMLRGRGFADSIGGRLEITVVDIHEKSEEPQKMEATVACEIVVEQGTHLNFCPPERLSHSTCVSFRHDKWGQKPAWRLFCLSCRPVRLLYTMRGGYPLPCNRCSTMPLLALAAAQGDSAVSAVSQVINMVYHSPATM